VYGVKFLPAIERGICEYKDGNFGRSRRHGNGKKRTCKEEEINARKKKLMMMKKNRRL
jgi:hypothetical protein